MAKEKSIRKLVLELVNSTQDTPTIVGDSTLARHSCYWWEEQVFDELENLYYMDSDNGVRYGCVSRCLFL